MTVTAHKIKVVSDRVQRAKDFLLSQFKDSPNINALVDVLVTELQELEYVLCDLQEVRTLKGSYGVWLDRIGEELKVDRGNYADDDYKTAIKIAMAKKTSSATAEDILFIVELLTGDSDISLENNYPYLLELTGYLFCLSDSQSGLASLADLFPVNTRVRLIKQYGKSFKFGTVGRGFGSGSTLNSLVYHRYGNTANDDRFTSSETEVIPVTPTSPPFIISSPTISGGNVQGDVVSVDIGEWGGDIPITYTYQWLRGGLDIVGETNTTYTITPPDLGLFISCRVTATNSEGSAESETNEILVSADVPPTVAYTSNLGMEDIYGVEDVNYIDNKVAYSALNIYTNGATERVRSVPTVINPAGEIAEVDQWLETTGVGAGDNYTISYVKVAGDDLSGMQPNIQYSLDVNRLVTLTTSGQNPSIKSGTYTFTIRNTLDSTAIASRTISLTSELMDTIS